MSKEKACKHCKRIYEGDTCPNCERKETTETFKGKVEIISPDKSEIAKELKVNKPGLYAVKI
ncbi:MAG: transcription elongation factor subunit Spt4 [Candidatus Pacearchaeota archaeon]|jgi:DNA-directed RNA polymerase subunit E"